jgi:hypothetical protein
MTTQSNSIMFALGTALRSALAAHPHLCPECLEDLLADASQIDDILRESAVRIFPDDIDNGYCIMSPHHLGEDGEPFYCGVFVGLHWLDQYASATREEFAQAYLTLEREHGPGPAHYDEYLDARIEANT